MGIQKRVMINKCDQGAIFQEYDFMWKNYFVLLKTVIYTINYSILP